MSSEISLAHSSLAGTTAPKINKVLEELSTQRDRAIAKVKTLQTQNIQLRATNHQSARYRELCGALER